ncbi:GIP [Symbiodinium sp. CCMP2592]|nr:GIP [Symbiodinium sp. CCMP2592]
MANIGDETDEELTGPSGATASAQPFGPAPFAQPTPTNPFQPTSPTNAGTEIAMTAADLRVLMQRMSEATQAATAAAQAAAFASTAQGSRPMGVGDLTKVLPKPDPFRPTTRDEEFAQWPQWSWTFEQYLSCLEPEFRQQTAVILSSLDESAKRRSRLLYGMLNGLLYERGRRLLRSVQDQNGFEAWRLLSKDLMPKTRNRVLALLRTINSWPSFAAQQGLAQQLLRLESAFEEYERLQPDRLPENNKMATLLSCLTGQLRQRANVVISDDSSYSDLRELVLRWDGANTKWQTSKPGHYKRDCFQFKAYMQGHQKGARQVQANSSAASEAGTSTTAPSSASALQAQQGKAGQSTVRRVAAEPLLFDMSDLEDPFPYEPNVCMVTVTAPQSFAMDSQDDDDQWTLPPDDYAVLDLVPLIFKGYPLAVNAQIRRVEREEQDVMHYNPGAGEVNNNSEDEASEGELHAGLRQSNSQQQVRDANSQQQVRDANSQQQVRDADSQQVRDADSQQVRDADSQQVRDADSQQVRFEATTLESLDFGWQVSSSGSTLICRSGTWFLLEHCVPWADLKEVEAVLPGGQVAEVISFLHVQVEPVSEIGVQLPAGMTEPQGLPEPDFYHFRAETEQAPVGTVEHDRVVPEDEAMQGLEDAAGQSSPAPMPLPEQLEAGVPAGNVEPLSLDGVLISQDSSLAVLKTAAAKLNLSTAGSKSRLFSRVKGYLEKQRLALELELAADAQSSGERQPRVQPVAAAPTEAERFLHECTHLPFKPWCPHCISVRAMPDRSEYLKEGPRDNPIIQFDFSFSGYSVPDGVCNLDAAPEDSQRALKCLVAHDSATGMIAAYRVIGNMTAYERACGAKYSGRIAPFAEPVYCQLDVKQKGDKRWMLGILVSKSSLNDMYIIAGKDGIRLSRSIRRVGQPWELEVQLYRELKGYPWDYGSGVIGTKFVAMPKQRNPAVDPVPDVAPPRSPDEAASEPPTPAVEALGMPVTPLGGAGAMAPPRRNVPPPESARAVPDERMAVTEEPPGPNPSMRPDPPSTPEAELPPLKKLRIRAVTFGEHSYEVNDEGEFDLDQPDGWEVQTKLWSMESEMDDSFTSELKADPEAEVAEDDDRLWFADNGKEPELDDAILAELDNLADQVEVSRLLKKSVLRDATSDDDLASMNTDIVRLIPAQWLTWKQTRPSEQYAILALDVKDAYLEVPQPTPVVSKVQGRDLVFMRMVPGQREGSQQWFSHFCEYLGEHFVVEKCKECPAVVHVSSKPGSDGVCADKGPGMIHVDDSLLLLPLQWARECFLPVIEQRFQITYELAYKVVSVVPWTVP